MIAVVEEHNRLTGYRFVIVEYGMVGAVFGVLGGWYIVAGSALDAIIWLGISANCAVVALLAEAQLRGGAPDIGIRAMRDPDRRAQTRREHPHLLRHTLALVAVSMLPLLLLALVVAESVLDALRWPRTA